MTSLPAQGPAGGVPEGTFPLLPAQRGMLEGYLSDPLSSSWSVALLTRMDGDLDLPSLTRAIQETTQELDALRLRIDASAEPPTQWVAPSSADTVEVVTLDADEDAARRLADELVEQGWELSPARPLITHTLIRTKHGLTWLQRGLHAVIDGYGGWLMRHRVVERYNRMVHGTPMTETSFPLVRDIAESTVACDSGAAYYRQYLAGAPERLSPAERNRPVQDFPHRHDAPLPDDVRERLAGTLGNRVWTYPLIAATAAYCARICEEDEAVIGMPVLGRTTAAERTTPVQMMTVLPLRVRSGPGELLREVTTRAVADARAARPYAKVQAQDIFQAVPGAWKAGRFHGPVVNVMPYDEEPVIPGVTVSTTALQRGPVYDLLFTVHPGPDGTFVVEGRANRSLYTAEETRWITERLVAFLDRATAPGAVLADVDHRLDEEVEAAQALAALRPGTRPSSGPPAWGEQVPLERLRVDGLAEDEPRGYEILDRLGHQCGWHQVGELVVVTRLTRRPTGILVSLETDGSLVCHGLSAERRQVRGRYVEAGAVAHAVRQVPGVEDARVRWEGQRLAAEVVACEATDTSTLVERVRRCAPPGSRMLVHVVGRLH